MTLRFGESEVADAVEDLQRKLERLCCPRATSGECGESFLLMDWRANWGKNGQFSC